MADIYFDVDAALSEVPVNIAPLVDDTDFKTIEGAVAYNAAGMALRWHFVTSAGAYTVTSVTPTTAGTYDWTDQGDSGIYTIEIPATGGASINNDTEGYGWFTGVATGILPWRSPVYGFRAAALNDALLDGGDNLDVNTVQWLGTACATPTTAGVPEVDVTHILGGGTYGSSGQLSVNVRAVGTSVTAVTNMTAEYDGTGYAGGTTPRQVVLTTAGNGAVADAVLDENVTDHRTANSLGAILQPVRSGTCQAGGSTTTVVLDSSASATNDAYKYHIIIGWVAADGTNKFASICSGYVGATKTATIGTIPYSPDATYTYVILPFGAVPGATAPTADDNAVALLNKAFSSYTTEGTLGAYLNALNLHVGTAQAGASGSITLDATGSSTTVDFYKYNTIVIRSGTGAGQSRQITAYSAARVATVDPAWTTAPDSTSEYIMLPLGIDAATVATISAGVWAATRAGNATAGSFGEYVNADATRLSGSATAADNAQAAFDGTGYGFTGCTIPTVTTVSGAVGSVTGDVGGDVVGSVASVTGDVGGNVVGSVASVTGAVGSVTGNVGGNVAGSVASVTAGVTLTNAGIDALFTRQLTESYAADGAAPTVAQALMLIQQTLGDFSISGTTLTVKRVDGSTSAATFTLNDATSPTSITRAS